MAIHILTCNLDKIIQGKATKAKSIKAEYPIVVLLNGIVHDQDGLLQTYHPQR